jgi:hypothetical protein
MIALITKGSLKRDYCFRYPQEYYARGVGHIYPESKGFLRAALISALCARRSDVPTGSWIWISRPSLRS